MKKLFSGILVCFLVAVSFLTTGCFNLPGGDDTGSLLYPSGTISGYKVCYKPSIYDFGEIFEQFSDNVISALYDYFTFDNIRDIEQNIIGAFTGGLEAVAGGIAAAVGFAFLFALIFHAHTKKN